MPESSEKRVEAKDVALPAILVGIVFAIDLITALGVATPMLYVLALLACMRQDDRQLPVVVAMVATGLTLCGYFLSPGDVPPEHLGLINRVLATLAIWTTALAVLWQRRTHALLVQERELAKDLATRAEAGRLELATSRKQLEDFKYALDQSAIVAMTDRAGKITYVNDKFCEISRYERPELIGQDHRMLNSSWHPKAFMQDLWRTIASGHIWRGEIRNRAKDGHLYWVDTTIVPQLGPDGKPEQYVAVRFEITDRKRAEEQLREQAALARLGEMASVVAHEVRNPLAGMAGALQIIGTRLPEGSEERLIIGDILERIGSLNLTLSDLLQYARPRQPQRKETDLRMILEGVAQSTRDDPRFRGIEVAITGGEALCSVDAGMLRGAIFNLTLNAAQAMQHSEQFAQRGGHVRLEVLGGQERCVLRVVDDGPGIPEAARARVLEPFFTTKARGTGLGLPIVKRIVDQHGGQLHLDCPPEGGTVVSIELPTNPS